MSIIKPGMSGYCKLCDSQFLPQINERIRRGENARQVADYLREVSKGQLTFARQTFYQHRDNAGGRHITDAEAPAPTAPASPSGEVKPVSNDQFLERIRDLAFAHHLEPEDARVDLKTGLAAVKILEERKQQKGNVLVLARIFTGQIPTKSSETIEGEFRELPAEPAQIGVSSD